MKNIVLVVAAHPDDELLGCGGTLIKHIEAGDEVHVVIMAEGLTSRDTERDVLHKEDELIALHKNSCKVREFLGFKSLQICGFPDNMMDSVPLLKIVKEVEKNISFIKPNIVYTHHFGDVNIDHKITHDAVITACRPVPGQIVREIMFFEILSSTECQINNKSIDFLPNVYEVLSERILHKKIEALRFYECEMRKWPHSRSYQSIEILAKYRGTSVGEEYAEAFYLGRKIKL